MSICTRSRRQSRAGHLCAAVIAAVAIVAGGCGDRRTGAGLEAATKPLETRVAHASFYGRAFEGRTTASGVVFDKDRMWAAHPHWPFGTRVRVTNLDNGRIVVVTIVDRGPARRLVRQGVLIDLARQAALRLDFVREGRARVRLEVLEWGKGEV